MVQPVVVVSGTPLWVKVIFAFAIVALFQIGTVFLVIALIAAGLWKFAPSLCKIMFASLILYILTTTAPMLSGLIAIILISIFAVWLIGHKSQNT